MAKEKRTSSIDMTSGSPYRLIISFTLPMLLGNIFQQLYNMVDSIVVGNVIGDQALAAVGTGFPIIYMLSSLFMGIGTSATVMISQYYGARDLEKVDHTINTIYMALLVGVVPLTLIGVFLSEPLLRLMQVPDDGTLEMAKTYMIIIFIGVIGNLGFNINAGILQGFGDSRTSLLFLMIATVMNIVLDLAFTIPIPMGVAGVALATIIAQIASWLFGVFYINRRYDFIRIRPRRSNFRKTLFVQAMRLGIPSGIQQALFSIGIMFMQSLVNSYGSTSYGGLQRRQQDRHLRLPAGAEPVQRADHLHRTEHRRGQPAPRQGGPQGIRHHVGGVLPGGWRAAVPDQCLYDADVQPEPGGYRRGRGLSARGTAVLFPAGAELYVQQRAARCGRYAGADDLLLYQPVACKAAGGLPARLSVREGIHLLLLRHRLGAGRHHLRTVLCDRKMEKQEHRCKDAEGGTGMIDWEKLEQCAKQVCNPRQLSKNSYAATVGAAIVTDRGNIYTGVCIDTPCSMGFCAEHAAAAAMVTAGENRVEGVVAVHMDDDGNTEIVPPCGRCREFLCQLHDDNHLAQVKLSDRVLTLDELLPFRWE